MIIPTTDTIECPQGGDKCTIIQLGCDPEKFAEGFECIVHGVFLVVSKAAKEVDHEPHE